MSLAVNAKLFGLGMAERRASKCPCSAYEIPCCASKNSLLRCVGNLLVSNWSCLLIGVQKARSDPESGKFPANSLLPGNFEGETGFAAACAHHHAVSPRDGLCLTPGKWWPFQRLTASLTPL